MQCFRSIRRKLFNASILNTELNASDLSAKSVNDVRTVIIGAGLAGLSAANHLIKHGFTRTIILEATNRYGGRVNSKRFGDAFCELGAKWISIDGSKDSMYELLKHATGLEKIIQQKTETYYVAPNGQRVGRQMPELLDLLFRKLCASIELAEHYRSGGDLHELNSVHTYFQAETTKIVNYMFKEEQRRLAGDIFSALIKEFGGQLGCCLEYVNIEQLIKLESPKTSPIYIPTGLDNVLNQITANIDKEHMQVGKPVGHIKWHSSTKGETKCVGCLDGSIFPADHIICTLPLGVLKNFSGYMFKPMLPREKMNAIENIGFGSPVKIYFEYKKHIEPWFAANIRPLWSAAERSEGVQWTKQVVEISKVPTSSRVLEVLIGGAYFSEIEKLPDAEVISEVTKLLRTLLRNPKIPFPTGVLRSDWSSSACYLGGRPYFSVGSTVGDVRTLSAPLGEVPSLLFAGDATILNGFGTVDGARMSGIREAQRIIEYYRQTRLS